ncbi:MAG TPA: C25 family cysteine peptidase [Bacteroidales bacterium]|nr:C25 family cysteine peptidase [Bacteroidales bacterium]
MRKALFTLLASFVLLQVSGADGYSVHYSKTGSTVRFLIGDFSLQKVNLNGTEFTGIIFPGRVTTMDKGFAELPFISANLQITPLKNNRVELIDAEYVDYQLDFPLVPSRGIIYRNQNPDTIPYQIAPESLVDDFYPEQLIKNSDPYIIKDVRGTTVFVYPFRYNAMQQTLRVYSSVTVRLVEVEEEPTNPLKQTSGKYFPDMEALYRSVFINYESFASDFIGEVGDILVITTPRDETAIQPYIDWKQQKGYSVIMEVVNPGTNVKSLIQNRYNENNNILYVQLVGDWADVKSDPGGGANAPMDPMLGCVAGSDNFPDIAIGRFSANSANQVTIQVNKTITYEKNPSGNWYSKAISVASDEGSGIGDDGEIDYVHTNIIYNYKLDPFTFNGHSTAYEPTGTSLMVKNYIETGAGIINYCGHGSYTSWTSTGFNNTQVNQLTNGNMLPFIFSVACVNGAFHFSGDCFAEAWLKKENGGAVLTLMSTINQPWQPPMRGQDYFNDLLTGGYNYTTNPGNGINTTEGRTILGSVIVNGLILMYTESMGTADLQTIQTWTIFGDPSLQARTKSPDAISLSNTTLQTGSPFVTTITLNGAPLKDALVSLSQNGVNAKAFTGANGTVSIPHEFEPGDVLLVVTGFNTQTIYENIQCTASGSAAVYFDNVEISDSLGNNNGLPDYGEIAGLSVRMKNSGIITATDVVVNLSTSDEFVILLNNSANYGNIPAGNAVTVENAFTIQINNDIPDQHQIDFYLLALSGDECWESLFTLTANAGILDVVGYEIIDSTGNNNGNFDPGETVQLQVIIKNTGHADASGLSGVLSGSDPYITVIDAQADYELLLPGQEAEMSFGVFASQDTPAGHSASFLFEVSADLGLSSQENFPIVIGQIPVLIVDLDGNNNSASVMAEALDQIGIIYELNTVFPTELHLYSSVFVCLGVYSGNHILSDSEGIMLAEYLNTGGRLYMEGGDTWYYDDPTVVHGMFGITGVSDGSGDLGTINGIPGTFAEGLSYTYTGDNGWIDHLTASGSGFLLMQNVSPQYGTAVANDAGTYKTIGASHEFGGLSGDRVALMEAYLDFFGLLPPPLLTQTIQIPAGWSGISSWLIPPNKDVEILLQPIAGNLIILQSLEGVYFPVAGINTIIDWDFQQGYKIKLNAPAFLEVTGWENSVKVLDLQAGWNIIPVMCNCNIPVELLFNGASQLQVITEIAGSNVYWPEMGISTLDTLIAGRAYMVRLTSPLSITFPDCE